MNMMNNRHDTVSITDIDSASGYYPSCQGPQASKKSTWRWKLRLINICGTVYFFVYSITALIVGTTVTLPELDKDDPDKLYYRVMLGWYIFAMLVLNYAGIVKTFKKSLVDSSTCASLLNDSNLTAEERRWRQCFTCNQLVPPRAKHCPLCDRCVLKRDHHCFFAGCCIGFHNQRYFIVFCLFGTLGALYSLWLTIGYLETYYAKLSSREFFNYLPPWVLYRWYSGTASVGTVSMVIYTYCCVVTMAACAHYFLWQVLLLYTGQSSYEYLKGVKIYQRPPMENLSSVFGPLWLLNFVFPMPFRNKGNGIEWHVSIETKDR